MPSASIFCCGFHLLWFKSLPMHMNKYKQYNIIIWMIYNWNSSYLLVINKLQVKPWSLNFVFGLVMNYKEKFVTIMKQILLEMTLAFNFNLKEDKVNNEYYNKLI